MEIFNKIKIVTNRLNLIPLDYHQLVLLKDDQEMLQSELMVGPSKRMNSKEVEYTLVHNVIPAAELLPEDILFITRWLLIDRNENVIVGDIGFKGAPGKEGMIEISYNTYPDFYNRGLMTEAITGIKFWAFRQPGVESIIAQTKKSNLASLKVLVRNGFSPFAVDELMYWWKLDNDIVGL